MAQWLGGKVLSAQGLNPGVLMLPPLLSTAYKQSWDCHSTWCASALAFVLSLPQTLWALTHQGIQSKHPSRLWEWFIPVGFSITQRPCKQDLDVMRFIFDWFVIVQGGENRRSYCLSPKQVRHSAEQCPKSLLSCKKSLDMKISSLQLAFLPSYAWMLLLPLQPCPNVVQSPWGQQDCGCCAAAGSWAAHVLSGQDPLKVVSLHWVWKVCRGGPDGVVKLIYLVSECLLVPVSHLARGPWCLAACIAFCLCTGVSLQHVPFSWYEIFYTKKTQQVCRIDHAKAEIALCWSQGPFKAGIIHLGDFSSTGLVSNLSYLNSLGGQPQTRSTQRN